MQYLFKEAELPFEALQTLNLLKDEQVVIGTDNLDAMFAGRRSALIAIRDFQLDNIRIARLEAKLSLSRTESGAVELLIHPVYRTPQRHYLLDQQVMVELLDGEKSNHVVEVNLGDDRTKTMIVEYDCDTREFLAYDAASVQVPAIINGEELDADQRQAYRLGCPVSIDDGTTVQYRVSEPKGILANAEKLILCFEKNGVRDHIMLSNIKEIQGFPTKQIQANSGSYQKGLQLMLQQEFPHLAALDLQTAEHRQRFRSR